MKKLFLYWGILFLSSCSVHVPRGSITGAIIDQTKSPVESALVFLVKNGTKIDLANTNIHGEYQFLNVDTGNYDIEIDATLLPEYQTKYVERNIHLGKEENLSKDIEIPNKYFPIPDLTTGQNQICIEIHVDTSGNVIDARIVYDITVNDKKYTTTTTDPDILNACIEKAKSVKYQPGKDEYRIIIFR